MTDVTLVQHKSGLWYRQGTYDIDVIKEQGSYGKIDYRPTDILLDLGANIGAFAYRYGPRVSEVHCFEPDSENYDLLCRNVMNLGNVKLYRMAVADYDGEATLFVQNGKNKGNHSLYQHGRKIHGTPTRTPVPVIVESLANVYARINPTIVKCDIEGGEYRSLLTTPTPDYVREVFVEIHFNGIKDSPDLARRLINKMTDEGFIVVRQPHFGPTLWHTLGHFRRSD